MDLIRAHPAENPPNRCFLLRRRWNQARRVVGLRLWQSRGAHRIRLYAGTRHRHGHGGSFRSVIIRRCSVEAAWDAEIERRIEAIESGEIRVEPWESVKRRIEKDILGR